MSDELRAETTSILPDIWCPHCGAGLDIWERYESEHWLEGGVECPRCNTKLRVTRHVFTTFDVVEGE